jgi:hypothetical protein
MRYNLASDQFLGFEVQVITSNDFQVLYGIVLDDYTMIVKSLDDFRRWVESEFNLDIPHSIWHDGDSAWSDIHDIFQKTHALLTHNEFE